MAEKLSIENITYKFKMADKLSKEKNNIKI
jgi:hypothetical protein